MALQRKGEGRIEMEQPRLRHTAKTATTWDTGTLIKRKYRGKYINDIFKPFKSNLEIAWLMIYFSI